MKRGLAIIIFPFCGISCIEIGMFGAVKRYFVVRLDYLDNFLVKIRFFGFLDLYSTIVQDLKTGVLY